MLFNFSPLRESGEDLWLKALVDFNTLIKKRENASNFYKRSISRKQPLQLLVISTTQIVLSRVDSMLFINKVMCKGEQAWLEGSLKDTLNAARVVLG